MNKVTFSLFSALVLSLSCFAEEPAPSKTPAPAEKPLCCQRAEAKGKTCKNPCCVEAAKQGKVCEKCLKHKHHGKEKASSEK